MDLRPRLWAIVAAILLTALSASVGSRASVAQAQSAKSVLLTVDLPERPAVGATLFDQKGCARCHAIGTEGSARIGPDLGRVTSVGDVLDLAGAFWNHAPVMKQKMAELRVARPTLTADEAANLVAYLTAFRYYETQIREAGNPALGSMVFVKKGCAACHEPGPERKAQGPDLKGYRGRYAPILFTQAMWNHSPAMTKAMQAKGMPPPTFTGREMTDLAAYLQVGLAAGAPDPVVFEPGSPRRGRDLFASKGCKACHAVAGNGGQGGPALGGRGRAMARSVPEIAGMMWNHSQQMNAEFARREVVRPTFSGQEMADVIAYLYFVNYANVRGTPFRGGQIFSQKCASCHTLGRSAIGPDLLAAHGLDQPIGIIASMWNHATAMESQSSRQGRAWPRLERGETADLAAFLISSRAGAREPIRNPKAGVRP
jgi:cytochrome c2